MVIVGATNLPWNLDDAFTRRFEKRLYIPLPDRDARKQILHLNMKGENIGEDVDFDELAEITEVGSNNNMNNMTMMMMV